MELVKAGNYLGNMEVQLRGWRESFFSDPSLDKLLSLLEFTKKSDHRQRKDELHAAIARIKHLLKKEKSGKNKGRTYDYNNEDHQPSKASLTLLCQVHILQGQYQAAIDACAKSKPVGWSNVGNPKGQVVPVLLKLLVFDVAEEDCPNITQLWTWTLGEIGKEFQRTLSEIILSASITQKQKCDMLHWIVQQVEERVSTIVKNQYRNSYGKAALILKAVAEALLRIESKEDAQALIVKYRSKFSRHRAFLSELSGNGGTY